MRTPWGSRYSWSRQRAASPTTPSYRSIIFVFTPPSSNLWAYNPVVGAVEVFSTPSNRPDEVLLQFECVILPCISRISSKERGDALG